MKIIAFKNWLAIALFTISAMAYGHNFHAGISDVSMNTRTGNTEIVHTFMTHDVDALLDNLYQRPFDLDDPDDVAIFRRYIEKQFAIYDNANKPYPIKWVGLKADPNYVMIFQEIEHQELPEKISIRQAMLTDFLADQLNTLNFSRSDKQLQTYTFQRKNSQQTIP